MSNKLINGPTIAGTLHGCPHCGHEFFAPFGTLRCSRCDFIWFRRFSNEPAAKGTVSVDGTEVTVNLLTTKEPE